jgi:phosphatidate cytidylyltransferase
MAGLDSTNKRVQPQSNTLPRLSTNLQQRWRTALTLGPIVLLLVALGGWWFFGLATALALIGVLEFCNLGWHRGVYASPVIAAIATIVVIYGFMVQGSIWLVTAFALAFIGALGVRLMRGRRFTHALADALMTCAAPVYIALPVGMLVTVRATPDGLVWLLLLLFMTWGTDSMAYFSGRQWGRTLLAPQISPKKTVEGALVGYVGGALVSALLLIIADKLTPETMALVLFGPIAAIVGDLGESALKRLFDAKDSHLNHFNLFPGHGGVLDRCDSLILVAWVCYAVFMLMGVV